MNKLLTIISLTSCLVLSSCTVNDSFNSVSSNSNTKQVSNPLTKYDNNRYNFERRLQLIQTLRISPNKSNKKNFEAATNFFKNENNKSETLLYNYFYEVFGNFYTFLGLDLTKVYGLAEYSITENLFTQGCVKSMYEKLFARDQQSCTIFLTYSNFINLLSNNLSANGLFNEYSANEIKASLLVSIMERYHKNNPQYLSLVKSFSQNQAYYAEFANNGKFPTYKIIPSNEITSTILAPSLTRTLQQFPSTMTYPNLDLLTKIFD